MQTLFTVALTLHAKQRVICLAIQARPIVGVRLSTRLEWLPWYLTDRKGSTRRADISFFLEIFDLSVIRLIILVVVVL